MSVRAKFICVQNEAGRISLRAVFDGSEENKSFFDATPNGSIELEVVNPPAAAAFVAGHSYYVDFTPTD